MLEPLEILKAILDNSPDSIILISPEHKIITYNKPFKDRIFSFSGKTISIGDDARAFIIPENKELYSEYFTKALNGENVVLQTETKNIWFEYRLNPVYNTSNELMGVTLIVKNIDKEKKAEIEIANQLKKLQHIAWQQSHEIRRPLSNILGIINLMKLEENISPEKTQEYLNYLLESAEELDRIIHNIVEQTT